MKYPSDNFDDIYKIITNTNEKDALHIKSTDSPVDNKDDEIINMFNYFKIKINLYINDIESIDQKFSNNKFIYRCKFGSNIKTIDDNAFYKCENLSFIEFSPSITKIGNKAFCKCFKLNQKLSFFLNFHWIKRFCKLFIIN